jgi:hypothetical protein
VAQRRAWLTAAILVGIAVSSGIGLTRPAPTLAVAEDVCQTFTGQKHAGQIATSGNFLIGARATIEGQELSLCEYLGGDNRPSGSFHWAAIQYGNPAWGGVNIVQVGYGHCLRANNGFPIGTNCNGLYYWYWAWGSYCGSGSIDGTFPGVGPVGLRIGSALSSPPATKDYYVIRELIGGTYYYSGYVNGALLSGLDANGNQRTARVPASSVCWNGLGGSFRQISWFGETFNIGDSMGGWNSNGTRNHLDHDPLRYSYNTGWKPTNLVPVAPCNGLTTAPYSCTIAEADHIYIDTNR